MEFNPVGGSIAHLPGAGFPGAERVPSTFQTLEMTGTARWQLQGLVYRAYWASPLILSWPQMRDEQATGVVPRRLGGCVLEIEITTEGLLDSSWLHIWKCSYNFQVSSGKHDRLRNLFRVNPEISEDLAEANLCKRWTMNPAPKQWRLMLEFNQAGEPPEPEINIQGHIRPLTAGYQP